MNGRICKNPVSNDRFNFVFPESQRVTGSNMPFNLIIGYCDYHTNDFRELLTKLRKGNG
jgi:hypothetical protein